jgi:hypothetical protein
VVAQEQKAVLAKLFNHTEKQTNAQVGSHFQVGQPGLVGQASTPAAGLQTRSAGFQAAFCLRLAAMRAGRQPARRLAIRANLRGLPLSE